MSRMVGVLVLLLWWSALACSQGTPTIVQWISIFEQVRQHPLFSDLTMTYAKAPAANIGFTPMGVIERAGIDCVVVVSDGENPKMARMMAFPTNPATTYAFMQTVAAHEFGHCLRMRGKHLSLDMWQRVEAAEEGTVERLALEKLLSIEEAYADAYAFVYLKDTHPQLYDDVLLTMQSLRHEPTFANPFYQVEPLYAQLKSQGINGKLPLHDQVQAVMVSAKFH
jgi:ureidoglycolate hydrolase